MWHLVARYLDIHAGVSRNPSPTKTDYKIRYGRLGGILALLRRADRFRPREFGIHESDGAPDEKERRPKHATTWLPSVHDGAVKCGLGVRRAVSRLTQAHRAVPS